jgi:hypothetical protein
MDIEKKCVVGSVTTGIASGVALALGIPVLFKTLAITSVVAMGTGMGIALVKGFKQGMKGVK